MPLCFSSNQTCNRCSFSVDVHAVAALLQSRFPTLPAKRVEMNLSPWCVFAAECATDSICCPWVIFPPFVCLCARFPSFYFFPPSLTFTLSLSLSQNQSSVLPCSFLHADFYCIRVCLLSQPRGGNDPTCFCCVWRVFKRNRCRG